MNKVGFATVAIALLFNINELYAQTPQEDAIEDYLDELAELEEELEAATEEFNREIQTTTQDQLVLQILEEIEDVEGSLQSTIGSSTQETSEEEMLH